MKGLRQNVVKRFYAAEYLTEAGEKAKRCIAAESPDAAVLLAKSIAADENMTLLRVEPVNPSKTEREWAG